MGRPPWRTRAALVFFFLKTYFFRPRNNPVFLAAGVFLFFFHVEGSLDKQHVALLFYLSAIAHYFTGNMFGGDCGASKAPIERCYLALPVEGSTYLGAYILSSLVYASVLFSVFALILSSVTTIPDLLHAETVRIPGAGGETISVYRGFAVSARGIQTPMQVVLERSFLVDAFGSLGRGRWALAAYYILVFLYIAVLHVYRQFGGARWRAAAHGAPLLFYLALGLVFATELIFTQKEIGPVFRLFAGHIDSSRTVLLGAAALTLTAILSMTRAILRRMEAR